MSQIRILVTLRVDPAKGDAVVYLLDKGILRLAQGDPAGALKVLRSARDVLDANYRRSSLISKYPLFWLVQT